MGPRYRATPRGTRYAPRTTPSTNPSGDRGSTKIRRRTPQTQYYPTILEPLCSKLLLREKEGWQVTSCSRLQTTKQMDEKEQECITINPICRRPTGRMYTLHQIRYTLGIQQHSYQTGRRMESCIPDARRIIRTNRNVLWTH